MDKITLNDGNILEKTDDFIKVVGKDGSVCISRDYVMSALLFEILLELKKKGGEK